LTSQEENKKMKIDNDLLAIIREERKLEALVERLIDEENEKRECSRKTSFSELYHL